MERWFRELANDVRGRVPSGVRFALLAFDENTSDTCQFANNFDLTLAADVFEETAKRLREGDRWRVGTN